MRQIKNQNLAELLMQLRFTPPKKRRKQLDSAEKLLGLIDGSREYPFEFVCFKITGFHPKSPAGRQLIKGDELAEDLMLFITKLSGQVARPVAEQGEKVYNIERLAAALGVSTKTINRWQKRGLIARKFIFDDGKKRFGFAQSTVDKFLKKNPDLIAGAKTFTRLTKKQKQQIVKRAAALAAQASMSRYQVIDKIAAEIGRAHETVRYTLLDYEKANPDRPVSNEPPGVISPAGAGELYKLFKQGRSVRELMGRFRRSRSSIYRIVNRRRARTLLARKIEFITSDEFLEDDAEGKILVPPLGRAGPLLNRERELELFRRYNYLKFLAWKARTGIKPNRASSARLGKIENYLAEAETIKKRIIEANLRLVVSIANKHTVSGANLPDLISEGNFALMNAVEKFDYTRGFRFATYASWAIAKDYAHKIPASARPDKAATASLADIQRYSRTAETTGVVAVERARRNLVQAIKNELDEREQYIILNHFGLVPPLRGVGMKKRKKTLMQIGRDLNLSRERIRQLELVALQKLRRSLSIEEFELLTG